MRLRVRTLLLLLGLLMGGCVPDFSPFTVVDDAGVDGGIPDAADAGP